MIEHGATPSPSATGDLLHEMLPSDLGEVVELRSVVDIFHLNLRRRELLRPRRPLSAPLPQFAVAAASAFVPRIRRVPVLLPLRTILHVEPEQIDTRRALLERE